MNDAGTDPGTRQNKNQHKAWSNKKGKVYTCGIDSKMNRCGCWQKKEKQKARETQETGWE